MSSLSSFFAGPTTAGPGMNTVQGNGAMKAAIILFDSIPGTRNFTSPIAGRIRVAVVGAGSVAGGGYAENVYTVTLGQVVSYTVGAGGVPGSSDGGTSSWGGVMSATGGSKTAAGAGGTGSGGSMNTSGGIGGTSSGGASGHRFGNGGAGSSAGTGGGGWTQDGSTYVGGCAGVDGWGLGLTPGLGGRNPSATDFSGPAGYGAGGGGSSSAGIGGGAGVQGQPGLGGGCDSAHTVTGGKGVVIVEVIG